MPEVPEVALTAQILNKKLKNKELTKIRFISGKYTKKKPKEYEEFKKSLPLKIIKINSHGKFMWFELQNNWFIWNTFGLTGLWSFYKPNFIRAILTINNKKLYYSDQLNYGSFRFSKEVNKKLKTLGPDFLKNDFTLNKITNYDLSIVKLLMDQKKIGSGLGNYLVAEILYKSRLSPYRLGSSLTKKEIKNLTYWIKYMTKLAYYDNHIGYMINLENEADKIKKIDYHPSIELNDDTFTFDVYRQKEDTYGNKVKADKIIDNRTTYWVPHIQK